MFVAVSPTTSRPAPERQAGRFTYSDTELRPGVEAPAADADEARSSEAKRSRFSAE